MRRGREPARRAAGFTYLGLLALIALIGILLAAAGEITRTAIQRDHEQELLWVGHQYRDAIGRFVAHNHRYPATLAELLGGTAAGTSDSTAAGGSGGPAVAAGVLDSMGFRALRRLYRDPITNSTDWVRVPAPDGQIMGVASASTLEPLKHSGFDDADVDFDKAASYAEWRFVYEPQTNFRLRPGAQPTN